MSRLLLAVLVLGLAFVVGWRVTGGHLERVESPSMGTRAPVGSLLWVRPVDAGVLRAGDFITFHPPGHPEQTYSHLVRAVHGDGTLSTQGAISGKDPWRVEPSDVVGRVVHVWRGIGWIVQAAPVLLLGALVIALLVRVVRRSWRLSVVVGGASLALTAALMIYQPLVQAEQLAFVPIDGGGARASYVGTGVFPIRMSSWDGADAAVVRSGQVASVDVRRADPHGSYAVSMDPQIPAWFWGLLVGLSFLPAVWTTVVGPSSRE
ncbi:hypothetical protein FB382_001330 [Nocardioides ginsengisegetis]|uniref:Signal peptidase I n=1 Tax=Nocardioides ginsengisegetis TaxID=661491 RepID=A0A7W3P936_9ACTN|nr:hypothetical protein [Nocardioides ginsengisegetis]MBA8803039.1 hypothetical protein [Nocardioides ginsengisegetis]